MLILSIMLLLSSNAVSTRRDKSILYARDAIIILILCFLLGLNSFFDEFHGKSLGLYHGLFHTTTTTHVFHLFIFFISALILQFNAFYGRKLWHKDITGIVKPLFNKVIYYNSFVLNKMSEQYRIIEYPLVILFVITGGVFLVSSSDLISVFLSIELQSYGLYILCSMYRNSEKATTAGLTYFLLGGLSSCFILLGSALLYGNSGNTAFDSFYIINNISNSINYESVAQDLSLTTWYNINYIHFSLVIMSVGFLFKVTAAPFHFWSPDVYDSIPTIVTTFVAIFAKISIFILLLELVHYTNSFYTNQTSMSDSLNNSVLNFSWTFTLLLSSLLSLIIGSVMGLTQFRIKRLFAYSTISHVGFILLALSINSIESIQSFLFYLMQYSLSNLNAFAILITMGYSLYLYVEVPSTSEINKDSQKDSGQNVGDSSVSTFSNTSTQEVKKVYEISDRKNSPIQLISQIKGYFYINPVVALSFGITIFSFVGIPPLVGFFAKQMVLSSALDNGYVFMSLVAILTSVVSAYYYLALIKNVFFEKSDYKLNPQLDNVELKGLLVNRFNNNSNNISFNTSNISISGSLSITISILTLAILLFILNPQEWLSITNILSIILFNC